MFITKSDLFSSIREEDIDAITENDDATVEEAIDSAITEVESYLSARYDTDAIFDATGDDRNKLVKRLCINVAVYEIVAIAQPGIDMEDRKDRRDRAIKYLEKVQAGKANPKLPVVLTSDDKDAKALIISGSNPKRQSHY